jgi:hypothetical protein
MIAERPTMPAVLGLLSSLGGVVDGVEEGVLTGAAEVEVELAGFEEEALEDPEK